MTDVQQQDEGILVVGYVNMYVYVTLSKYQVDDEPLTPGFVNFFQQVYYPFLTSYM